MFVLLFIFVKRQIMRFAMRSRRGPHAPIGHNATKVVQIASYARWVDRGRAVTIVVYWICFCRDWKRRSIPGFPGSKKSASNLVSCQRKMIGWSRDHKLVSHVINSRHCHLIHPVIVCCCVCGQSLKMRFFFLGCYNYLYRMKALDAIRDSGYSVFMSFIKQLWTLSYTSALFSKPILLAYIRHDIIRHLSNVVFFKIMYSYFLCTSHPFFPKNITVYRVFLLALLWPPFPVSTSGIPLQEISQSPSAFTGRNFRNWLMELRNSHSLIKSSRSALIDRLLEGYDNARHGTGVCGHGDAEKFDFYIQ